MFSGVRLTEVAVKRVAFFSWLVCAVWFFWKAQMCMSFSALNIFFLFFSLYFFLVGFLLVVFFFLFSFYSLTPSILVLSDAQYLGLVVSGYIGIQNSLLFHSNKIICIIRIGNIRWLILMTLWVCKVWGQAGIRMCYSLLNSVFEQRLALCIRNGNFRVSWKSFFYPSE